MSNKQPWFYAEPDGDPYQPEERRVRLVRRVLHTDPDDPWGDRGCAYVLSRKDAEALRDDLVRVLEEV